MSGEPDQLRDARSRRRGRGRLSSIEMLPEEADEAIAWANQELRTGKLPQTVILAEFNEKLADLGLKPISKGAFSRYSVREAIELRKVAVNNRLVDTLMRRLPPGERSKSAIAATEMLKYRILELVMSQDEPDLKALDKFTLSLRRMGLEAASEKQDERADRKESREDEDRKQAARKGEASEATGGAAADPVDADTVLRRIREDVYGIFDRSGEEQ